MNGRVLDVKAFSSGKSFLGTRHARKFQSIAPFGGKTRNACDFQPKHFLLDGIPRVEKNFHSSEAKINSLLSHHFSAFRDTIVK